MAQILGSGIDVISKKYNLQRTYLWELRLPSIGGIDGLEVSKLCQEIDFGDYTMNEVSTMRYGAFQNHYAGFLSIQSVEMTFLRPIPDIVTAYFDEWRKLIVDEQGYYSVKNNYAKRIYIVLLDNAGNESTKFILVGSFPTSFPRYPLSYKTNEIVHLRYGFSVDRVLIEQ